MKRPEAELPRFNTNENGIESCWSINQMWELWNLSFRQRYSQFHHESSPFSVPCLSLPAAPLAPSIIRICIICDDEEFIAKSILMKCLCRHPPPLSLPSFLPVQLLLPETLLGSFPHFSTEIINYWTRCHATSKMEGCRPAACFPKPPWGFAVSWSVDR